MTLLHFKPHSKISHKWAHPQTRFKENKSYWLIMRCPIAPPIRRGRRRHHRAGRSRDGRQRFRWDRTEQYLPHPSCRCIGRHPSLESTCHRPTCRGYARQREPCSHPMENRRTNRRWNSVRCVPRGSDTQSTRYRPAWANNDSRARCDPRGPWEPDGR